MFLYHVVTSLGKGVFFYIRKIHDQLKVFGYPQKNVFLVLKVLFLMKQVKHCNVFYIILNTSLTQ